MRRSHLAATIGLAALAFAPLPTTSTAPEAAVVDDEPECQNLDLPAALSTDALLADADPVTVRVLVLFAVEESAEVERLRASGDHAGADALLASIVDEHGPKLVRATEAYEPLGIEVELVPDVLSLTAAEAANSDEVIEAAKDRVGGTPPAGIDAVYAAVGLDLQGSVAGEADCVGGMAYDRYSFAVGELELEINDPPFFGSTLSSGTSAKILAHELGHLLGAQHHLGNCAESIPTYPDADSVGHVCTLMLNDAFVVQRKFSSANAAVVRGYAETYAGATGDRDERPYDIGTIVPTVRDLLLENQLDGDDAGSGRDAGHLDEDPVSIEPGAYDAEILRAPVPDEEDAYTFDVTAGQTISIDAEMAPSEAGATYVLRAPDGTVLDTTSLEDGELRPLEAVADVTGSYSLQFNVRLGSPPRTYSFTLDVH